MICWDVWKRARNGKRCLLFPLASLMAAGISLSAAAATPAAIGNDDIEPPRQGEGVVVRVWPEADVGPVKPMNGSNSGPNAIPHGANRDPLAYHPNHRFDDFRDLEVPMIRTHDSRFSVGAPNRVNDIALIFPDFDADENDPKNYDFLATDDYLDAARSVGCEIMYFLGSSCDTEMGGRPCGTDEPPKDFAKWARIVEHVVRHYNEGWGWSNPDVPFSNQFNIVNWEIWNEPDLDCDDSYWTTGEKTFFRRRRYWHGSPEQFFDLYRTTALHLKRTFPGIKVGGPGLAGRKLWAEHFVDFCEKNGVPLDFFTYHGYMSGKASNFSAFARQYREMLDRHGFKEAQTFMNEWNWHRGWGNDQWSESVRLRSDPNNFLIAAFYAATFSVLQHEPVDGLMYYDMRANCYYNGVFASNSSAPLKGYYAFYAWKKLRRLGREVKSDILGADKDGVYAVAAKGKAGSLALLVTRSVSGADALGTIPVRLSVAGRSLANARLHVTDELERYTERTLRVATDGTATIRLRPHAFAVVELP